MVTTRPEIAEPMVHLLGRLQGLRYGLRPYGSVFDLTTPDKALTLTVTEAEYVRDPAGCVSNIRRVLRRAGYPT